MVDVKRTKLNISEMICNRQTKRRKTTEIINVFLTSQAVKLRVKGLDDSILD